MGSRWWRPLLVLVCCLALAPLAPAQTAAQEADALLAKAIANQEKPGELQHALEQVEALAARSAADAHIEYARGWMQSHLGRADEAIASYRRSVRLDPALSDAHYNLGVLLAGTSAKEEALRAFEAALRADPKHGDAAYNAGQSNYDLERYGAALEKWRICQKLTPDDFQVARKVLQALHALGLQEEAAVARDNVRRILRGQLDPAAKSVTRYCFDQLPLEGGRVFAYEYTEAAKVAPRVYHFVITDLSQAKTLAELELASGEGSGHVLRVLKPADKFPPREFADRPAWRELKPIVRELARELLPARQN